MEKVVEKVLAGIERLLGNLFLTGSHRFTAMFRAGTRQRDMDDLTALVERVRGAYWGSPFNSNDFLQQSAADVVFAVQESSEQALPMPLLEAIYSAAFDILHKNFFLLSISEGKPGWDQSLDFQEEQEVKAVFNRRMRFIENAEEMFPEAIHKLAAVFTGTIETASVPSQEDDDTATLNLEAPLLTFVDDAPLAIERIVTGIVQMDGGSTDLFHDLRNQLWRNMALASGYDPCHGGSFDPCKCKLPSDHKGKTDEQLRDAYLMSTPFQAFFNEVMPLPVPEKVRFEHMHILAGSGHGKTQALQHMIVSDLQRPPGEVPAMVILDSQGDMLEKLQRLALFDPAIENSLAERLLIVDPSDVEFAPSLNLFDIQSDRLGNYDPKEREQVLAGIIEIYDYIFGGLLGAELTQKQSMVFRFLAQLMLAIPGATIHTLRDLLVDASPYMTHVSRLPDTARSFFETQFFEHGYKATREQILRRLYGVLQNSSFERMFASPQNRLDLFPVLNNGGIVLVNTAKDFLKKESSSIFGRYIIALTFKAAMERAILPEDERRPTFLWIDEASEFFDDNIDSLLIQARKFKLGVIMAHQYLGQLPRGLPASIMTNTSIKLAGGTSDKDARDLAREMRCAPEFILNMRKSSGRTSFATHVRNLTPQAMKLTIPFGTAERLPRMSDESFGLLLEASRKKLAADRGSRESAHTPAGQPNTMQPDPGEEEFWGDVK